MHILLIPSWYKTLDKPLSGIFFREQAHALKRFGHQVGILCMPRLHGMSKLFQHPFQWSGRQRITCDEGIITYEWSFPNYFWRILSASTSLSIFLGNRLYRRYCREQGKPDCLHAHSAFLAGVLAADLKKQYGVPYLITEHSTGFARNLFTPLVMKYIRHAFQNANARLMVSPQLGTLLEGIFKSDVCPWLHVPNMVDNYFQPVSTETISKKVLFRFLNVGYLTEKKGQENLLRAFALSYKNNPVVQMRIAGDGPLRSRLAHLSCELEVNDKVVFLGNLRRDEILKEMQESDVFVLSSDYETFGVVLVEALACGKPVVATECGGPESIVNNGNGILVPPKNIEALAEALQEIRNRYNEYDSERIYQDCQDRFSEKAVVQQLTCIYENILSRSRFTTKQGKRRKL